MKIRCCVGYGCQENALVEKKEMFWNFIEEEVETAWNSGSGFVLQFDGNLWAGDGIIPGDPRKQNNNGKLFQQFLSRQQKYLAQGLPPSQGQGGAMPPGVQKTPDRKVVGSPGVQGSPKKVRSVISSRWKCLFPCRAHCTSDTVQP